MAIRWQIPFRTLRSDSLLTVNVYDNRYSGKPTQLTGGAQPFVTEEDDDDDWFVPVRTQSGYLSIVDTGKDNDGNPFNWRDFIPTTDTDRPVTLTDEQGTILWQGFMQAQNFGSQLYEIPQERQFPVQCVLTVLSSKSLPLETEIHSFAYLLKTIILEIPSLNITHIIFQTFDNQKEWLLKQINWQLFFEDDNEGNLRSKYSLLDILGEICKYWGFTARTRGTVLYLMRIDDSNNQNLYQFTLNNLIQASDGNLNVGYFAGVPSAKDIGDNFASTNNNDYQMRGPNKATVSVSAGYYHSSIISIFPEYWEQKVAEKGFSISVDDNRNHVGYANISGDDGSKFYTDQMNGFCYDGSEFNLMYFREEPSRYPDNEASIMPVIRLLDHYTSYDHVYLRTTFSAFYHYGRFRLKASFYRNFVKYEDYTDYNGNKIGNKRLSMIFRVGKYWWGGQGTGWVTQQTYFYVAVGDDNEVLFNTDKSDRNSFSNGILLPIDGIEGDIEIRLHSVGDLDVAKNGSVVDIANFSLEYTYLHKKTEGINLQQYNKQSRDYVSKNNNLEDEWSTDVIFATYNRMDPGIGIVHNEDGTFYGEAEMSGAPAITPPEQLLANRVTDYWATSKRKIECELMTDKVEQSEHITPRNLLTIDGTTMWPIAISHDWRDDITRITAMETYER